MATLLGLPISEKLSKNNLQMWKLQVLPAIRGAQMEGYINGMEVAPPGTVLAKDGDKTVQVANLEYAKWVALDQ